jgi:HEAT repeat protein
VAEQARYAIPWFCAFTPPSTRRRSPGWSTGAAAVPALIAAMRAPAHGWQAAMALAKIGSPAAAPAVPALRAHLRRGSDASRWAAIALGRLGQLDELAALAAPRGRVDADRRALAIGGLVAARPASYPHLAGCQRRAI